MFGCEPITMANGPVLYGFPKGGVLSGITDYTQFLRWI